MALPSQFDPESFAATMAALKDGTSAADEVARPGFDPGQYKQAVEEGHHGRRIEQYRMALERAGFAYWPKGSIPPGCEGTEFEPPRPLLEGQWRRPPNRFLPMRLALTETQIPAWFSTPEEFWKWYMNLANAEKAKKARPASPIKIAVPRSF